MPPQVTLDQAQQGLAYLLNQDSVPQGEAARRAFYIKSAVERIYRAFDFDMSRQIALLSSDDTGLVDLGDYKLGIVPAIEAVNGTQPFQYVMSQESGHYAQGDFKYWVTLNEDKEWELHTTEPSADLTIVLYEAPEITNTQKACFTQMVIAKGSLIYYRQAQDPEADTSVEEDQFRQEMSEVIEAQNRHRPQRFATTLRDRMGHSIGEC